MVTLTRLVWHAAAPRSTIRGPGLSVLSLGGKRSRPCFLRLLSLGYTRQQDWVTICMPEPPEEFADEMLTGHTQSIRAIRARLHVGQPRAQQARGYLERLASSDFPKSNAPGNFAVTVALSALDAHGLPANSDGGVGRNNGA